MKRSLVSLMLPIMVAIPLMLVRAGCVAPPMMEESHDVVPVVKKEKCDCPPKLPPPKQPGWDTTCKQYRYQYDRQMKYIDIWWYGDSCMGKKGEDRAMICPSREELAAFGRMHQVLDRVFCGELPEDHYGERYVER